MLCRVKLNSASELHSEICPAWIVFCLELTQCKFDLPCPPVFTEAFSLCIKGTLFKNSRMVKNVSFGVRLQIPTLPWTSCVTLSKLLTFSVLSMHNGDNNRACLIGVL